MTITRAHVKSGFLILCWAFYDLANQFFTLNIISLYFPRWLTIEKGAPEILYSIAFGVSMLCVAICSPILGTISDVKRNPKTLLIYLTIIAVVFTIALGWAPNVILGLLFFAIANFGCQVAIIFYNALLAQLAPAGNIGLISGIGRMFGYSGAIVALYVSKPIVVQFGYQATFMLSGFLFLLFSLPCLIFVRDTVPKEKIPPGFFTKKQITSIFHRLRVTIREKYTYIEFRNFLKAAFYCLCVFNVIILFMAVYASKVFMLDEVKIINLIAFSTLFAIIGSFTSGWLSDHLYYKHALMGVLTVWGITLLAGALLEVRFYLIIGALAGTSIGATWSIFRAIVIKLVPQEKVGEAFGLFNLVANGAGVVGPQVWGIMLLMFAAYGSWGYRLSLFSLSFFIAVGFVFLLRLKKKKEMRPLW